MGSIEKIYQELKIAKITMEASNQQIKMDQAPGLRLNKDITNLKKSGNENYKKTRNGEAKTIQE